LNVKLSAVAEALEKSETRQGFVDIKRGEIVLFGDDAFSEAEKTDETEEERLERVFSIEDDWQRYVALPNIYEDERSMRADFAASQQGEAQQELAAALAGAGGIQRFNRAVRQLKLWREWQSFFHKRLLELARDWCEEYDVEYSDDSNDWEDLR
jgi:hypothetical protein